MIKYYMLLLQEYVDGVLVDNFYVKDSVYPGTLTYPSYQEALEASKEYIDLPNIVCVITISRHPKKKKEKNA